VFQFPLHRDPRCNPIRTLPRPCLAKFQFPLHRDPRCNGRRQTRAVSGMSVSVPFTSGSSLQLAHFCNSLNKASAFQFPLHRDPRCNFISPLVSLIPCMFQFPLHRDPRCNWKYLPTKTQKKESFSSLYIGILAATSPCRWPSRMIAVSVPFTSGSSLQRLMPVVGSAFAALTVSVPFTSGSSLQLAG